jgi:hypothetical protein
MVGMSECGPQGCGSGLNYFLTDHLDSVVAVVNPGGGLVSQTRYMPFGEVRTDVGSITQADYGYTGQLIENQPVKLYEWVNHLFGGRYDPYVSFWVELEAAHCQSAYVLDPGIPLNQSPCNLK